MTDNPAAAAMRQAFMAAGLDPAGVDLEKLAGIRDETERKIAAYRASPGFATAVPAFNPPARRGGR